MTDNLQMKEAALAATATPKHGPGVDTGFFPKGLTGVTIQWPKL